MRYWFASSVFRLQLTKALAQYGRTEKFSAAFLYCSSVVGWPFSVPACLRFEKKLRKQAPLEIGEKIPFFNELTAGSWNMKSPSCANAHSLVASEKFQLSYS